jgi:uncharacterized repeat protein (TIGR01451 family)
MKTVFTLAAAILLAVCIATPARAQVAPAVLQTKISTDGLLTLVLSSTNSSDAVGVNNTYTWTATNNSSAITLTGVILGSHWGDYCVNAPGSTILSSTCPIAPPEGPTLVSLAPGCGGQSPSEFPTNIAVFGIWCTPGTGVTLPPGASVSGSVTIRPRTGGPAFYGVYSGHDPLAGPKPSVQLPDPVINYRGVVAPAATDVQIAGAASTGSPSVGSTFTYTYQIRNGGPWGTFGGIIFADTLPASLTYVGSSVVQAAIDPATDQQVPVTKTNVCSAVGQTVVCPVLDMTVGGLSNQATIILTVVASGPPGQIANTASVHTVVPQDDSNIGNNSVTVNVASK